MHSEYIVYVDESGDHALDIVNAEYPIFVLAFCIFRKEYYIETVVPSLQEFKFNWFGHDSVILHEREIRKQVPPFQFLTNQIKRTQFMSDLSSLMENAPMDIIAAVIRKDQLKRKYVRPYNPYHLSLMFCMERLQVFLEQHKQANKITYIICEQRGGKEMGGKEDKELELEFLRIKDGKHDLNPTRMPNLELKIISKKTNSLGLQIADLVARPIGLNVSRPEQPNKAYEIIKPKIWHCRVFP